MLLLKARLVDEALPLALNKMVESAGVTLVRHITVPMYFINIEIKKILKALPNEDTTNQMK